MKENLSSDNLKNISGGTNTPSISDFAIAYSADNPGKKIKGVCYEGSNIALFRKEFLNIGYSGGVFYEVNGEWKVSAKLGNFIRGFKFVVANKLVNPDIVFRTDL